MSHYAAAVQPPPLMRLLTPVLEGAGNELARVEQRVSELRDDLQNSVSMTYRDAALRQIFLDLATRWRQGTRLSSSLAQITRDPAYKAIVELGEEVVPLLLQELRRQPEPWFAALREITHTDPVAPEQRGDMHAMAAAWLRWGKDHSLIQ